MVEGLSNPDHQKNFQKYLATVDEKGRDNEFAKMFSDARLLVLNSNYRPNCIVNFQELFPTGLTTLEFDASASDINYFTAEVNFKYTLYDITDGEGTRV